MRLSSPLARLILALLLLGGGFMGYKSWQEHVRNAKIQAEIDALRAEAEKIRRDNETLTQRIEYFASPDFQEQEAKKKLGLRRQEETVVSLHEQAVLPSSNAQTLASDESYPEPPEDARPNYQKWWQFLFGQ